jgi:uncharacterized RDD family membrane protein YckC
MDHSSESGGMGVGVYYAREEYAGLFQRFLIIAIDIGALLVFGAVLYAIWYSVEAWIDDWPTWFLCSWLVIVYVYLVFVESSSLGTLGFLLTNVKIVNLKGERPSVLRMSLRLLLWLLGPFNPVIDLLWLTGDRDRQTLRDKLAGTYVVKKDAVPLGKGKVKLTHYFLFGFSILFLEVQKPRSPLVVSK